MKKFSKPLLVFILFIFLISATGCVRHTRTWIVEVDVYNSTLKSAFFTLGGETKIIPARSWERWTIYCEDSETYCDLFETYEFKDDLFWDGYFFDHSGAGSGANYVYEDDGTIVYKLYYSNSTNIMYVDRAY